MLIVNFLNLKFIRKSKLLVLNIYCTIIFKYTLIFFFSDFSCDQMMKTNLKTRWKTLNVWVMHFAKEANFDGLFNRNFFLWSFNWMLTPKAQRLFIFDLNVWILFSFLQYITEQKSVSWLLLLNSLLNANIFAYFRHCYMELKSEKLKELESSI